MPSVELPVAKPANADKIYWVEIGSREHAHWLVETSVTTGVEVPSIVRQALILWAINRDVPLPPMADPSLKSS